MGQVTGKQEEEGTNNIIDEIALLDKLEADNCFSPSDRDKRNSLKVNLAQKLQIKATSWKQKSQKKWLKDRDLNSKYFHMLANHQTRVNFIGKLNIDGNTLKSNEKLRLRASNYFHKLYSENIHSRPKPDELSFNIINADDKCDLERDFTEAKILECLQDCDGDKAPRPNSYRVLGILLE